MEAVNLKKGRSLNGVNRPAMIDDTLTKIETIIANSRMATERKEELQGLMGELKGELETLADTHEPQAQSIAGFAKMSSHEATKETVSEDLVKLSMTGLKMSAEGFEATHPQLARTINAICIALSKAGI